MKKIGIIICGRYHECGGGKCFRALHERVGAFSIYPENEEVAVVGYSTCGGCPGGNVEYVPGEMKANGATTIHLATGLVVGYPPCNRIFQFRKYIETVYGLEVIIGTHPIPEKYYQNHAKLDFWSGLLKKELSKTLFKDSEKIRIDYN